MSLNSLESGYGVVITLGDLRTKLRVISSGAHQWTAHLARATDDRVIGWPKLCVQVWYSNPGLVDMPTQLCYRFPAFPHDIIGDESDSLVCVHASLMDPVAQGLYFEDDELKDDPLEDFGRFWEPLWEVLHT
jgi:hypothetical protein